MNDWTGIDYLHSVGDLTLEQIKPLRHAYNNAQLAFADDDADGG